MRFKKRKKQPIKDSIEVRVLSDEYGHKSNQPPNKVWQGINKKWRGKSSKSPAAGGTGPNPILPSLGKQGYSYP